MVREGGVVMIYKIVVFKLNEQVYGIDVNEIESIEQVTTLTPVPQVESYIRGLLHLRGQIIPVVDLKLKLSMEETKLTSNTKVIISKINRLPIGFLVDEATDVLDINVDNLYESAELIGENDHFINGIIKQEDSLILLIHFNCILQEKDLRKLQSLLKVKEQ